MRDVGPLVDELYRDGATKLLARLEDACDGYARAHVAVAPVDGAPVALAAEIYKGRSRVKLSTFWVSPQHRRARLGSRLLEHRLQNWRQTEVTSAAVTVRLDYAAELEALFVPHGFSQRLVVPNRYGIGRHEVVLVWPGAGALDVPVCAAA